MGSCIFWKKSACHKLVAMVASTTINTNGPNQIFPENLIQINFSNVQILKKELFSYKAVAGKAALQSRPCPPPPPPGKIFVRLKEGSPGTAFKQARMILGPDFRGKYIFFVFFCSIARSISLKQVFSVRFREQLDVLYLRYV